MVSFTQGDDSHFVGLLRVFVELPGDEMVTLTLPSYSELLLLAAARIILAMALCTLDVCRIATYGNRYLTQRLLQETVTLFLRDKTQAMGDALRRIFGVVGDKQQLRTAFANQHINKAAH